ncbi:MAG: hypothetical protein ABIG40_02770 [Parcubacteria group bacterium]
MEEVNMNLSIICTDPAEHIGKKLAAEYGFSVIFPQKNRENKRLFPDGEVYTKIPEIIDLQGEIVVLHSGAPDPNEGLVELEQILARLKNLRKKLTLKLWKFKVSLRILKFRPVVFFLYFPYGKQDRVFVPGEINSAEELIKKLVKYYGVKHIYFIDVHFSERSWLKKYPITNISAIDLLTQAALREYQDLLFLTTDMGGQKRTGLKGTLKRRLDSFTTEIQSTEDFQQSVRGKVIGAVDDLIETGGTMVNFYQECKKAGAREAVALLTHGVMESGIKRIAGTYAKLYLTNTINRPEANLDITGLVAGIMSKI